MNRRSLDTAGRRRRWPFVIVTLLVVAAGSAVVVAADASTPSHSPYGQLSTIRQVSAHFYRISGWTVDPDTSAPLRIITTVDGKRFSTVSANLTSPAVPSGYAAHGVPHGYVADVRLGYGTHRICAIAVDRGAGSDEQIGCRTRLLTNNPAGVLSAVRQVPGGVAVYGGATDPNTRGPIGVDIYANGKRLAGRASADHVTYHGHGFRLSYPLAAGTYSICATGINVSWGRDKQLGCRTITLNFDPTGAITSLVQVPGGFAVGGWSTDPDTSAPIGVAIYADSKKLAQVPANAAGKIASGHDFAGRYLIAAGTHRICVLGINVRFGRSAYLPCKSITLNYSPTASITRLSENQTGVHVIGQATDPDNAAQLTVLMSIDGKASTRHTASLGRTRHAFSANLSAGPGAHTVCVVALNVAYGTQNSPKACKAITLNFDPAGSYEKVYRRAAESPNVRVQGWAYDRGTAASIQVQATIDGHVLAPSPAKWIRTDVASSHPGFGSAHGFAFTIRADAGEHTVCVTALNVGAGSNTNLGCRVINAVHPKVPSAPASVGATGGYGGASITWKAPASDGGAPWTSYVVTSSPGGKTATVSGKSTTATVVGLRAKTRYTFHVTARNVAGYSAAGVSAAVTTEASPPPQKTPAPVSTSRYIRNIHGSTATDLNTLRAEGAADASYNPSGHGYLVLLDIGGQDQYDGGVVLSATTRFISYGDLVKNIKAYVDGYHSKQRASAPVTIAIGTNNDMEVTATAGAAWANSVVDPIRSYARSYTGITIAGANDIEPGFRGTYRQTSAWLSGYLGATSAAFIFNGSADGCAWTQTNRGCNNGWSMAGLYHLAAGAAPIRTINLPQIYNSTMAAQWKYISLTGVAARQPRINFGGALTEWTACDQANGCFSLTGRSAWKELWAQLQSAAQLRVGSLPYSTDLRIDK